MITANDALPEDEHYEPSLLDSVVPSSAVPSKQDKSESTLRNDTSVPQKVIDAMGVNMKPLVGKKPTGAQMIDTSNDMTIKKVANESMAKGDRVVIVLLEGSKNAKVNHIQNRIKAVAGLMVTQALNC